MTPGDGRHNERLSDLLADGAAQGFSRAEAAELDRLLAQAADVDAEAFERAAAVIDQVFAATDAVPEELPAALRARVEAAAGIRPTDTMRLNSPAPAPRRPLAAWGGWLAAAAAVVIAALGWMRGVGPGASSPAAVRTAVLGAADRIQWNWGAWGAKPASEGGVEFPAKNVGGEVVWSTAAQSGVMRFTGLARNNPGEYQYQLWIIDPAQKHPIDGGVFNVDADGEVLVAINPKIRVSDAAAFAITAEKPGGVVVSDQSKRVVIAAPAPPASKG